MCPWCLAPTWLPDSDPTLQLDGRFSTQANAIAVIFTEFGMLVFDLFFCCCLFVSNVVFRQIFSSVIFKNPTNTAQQNASIFFSVFILSFFSHITLDLRFAVVHDAVYIHSTSLEL